MGKPEQATATLFEAAVSQKRDEGTGAASMSKDTDPKSPITAEDVPKNAPETALASTETTQERDEGIAAASMSKDTGHESPKTAEDVQKNATETALVTTDNDLDSRLRASDDAALASGKLSEAVGINNDSLGPLTTASDDGVKHKSTGFILAQLHAVLLHGRQAKRDRCPSTELNSSSHVFPCTFLHFLLRCLSSRF